MDLIVSVPEYITLLYSRETSSLIMMQFQKRVREKSKECHNHKPQPFLDNKKQRKPTKQNKHKSNKRTKSTSHAR